MIPSGSRLKAVPFWLKETLAQKSKRKCTKKHKKGSKKGSNQYIFGDGSGGTAGGISIARDGNIGIGVLPTSSRQLTVDNDIQRQITEKDVGINLTVTPRINDASRITLVVDASVEALLSAAEVSTDKPRSTRRTVRTQVTVNDGDTVIIGGLIAENTIENKKFIPILSTLPFLGRMFQSTTIDKEQRELLIFITPNVVG